jgi:glutamate/tyrosine decarboxylase-like PLP-dependent enzyme
MSNIISEELTGLPELLTLARSIALDYLNSLSERSVAQIQIPATNLAIPLSESGLGTIATLETFKRDILPYLSASPGSRYWGFVTGGSTPASLVGDWLTSAVDQNLMVAGDSVATEIELATLGLIKDLFALPRDNFDGVFTTGATAANLVCMAVARQWGGKQLGRDIAREGLDSLGQFEILATTPHASLLKIMGILGFGQNRWTRVRGLLDANGLEGEAMNPDDLKDKLQASQARVKIVVSSAGTVTTTAFDDFKAISQICHAYNAWHHLDGAFGLFARCSPEYAVLTEGAELADSITVDCHKWLNVPYDCGIALTQHKDLLEDSFTVGAAYLRVDNAFPNMMNRGIENSQRFRALPVWFGLTAYGLTGYRTLIEQNCTQARQLANWIEISSGYQLLLPPKLNVVLFAGKFDGELETINDNNRALLREINQTGRVFLSPGNYHGQFCFRAAFSNWRTTSEDVNLIIQTLQQVRYHYNIIYK